ncbi:hypothetical protein GOP47_0031236, partial [Adiantum capillus-veneris]
MQTESESEDYVEQRRQWTQEQNRLKGQLLLHDDFPWKLSPPLSDPHQPLCLVGGVDLSFCKHDLTVGCGALVVLNINTMNVIYEDFAVTHLRMPYIPGFLAFRESPVLLALLEKLSRKHVDMYPQVLMVDGNGILHPRGFGLASHLGVLANIPTIGVAKNLYHVDGLCRQDLRMGHDITDASTPLVGNSGQVLGMALRSHPDCTKPIFVSVGHRISLGTAVSVVQKCCKYRIPEPVRQADIRSRKQIK